MRRLVRRCCAGVFGFVAAVCGVFAIEPTAHHDDAAQYWVMAGRLSSTSDPFYVAAVDHKGPLWVAMYRAAFAISDDQRWFWFIMAAQVVFFAVVVGIAVGWLLRTIGLNRRTAVATGGLVIAYLVFGPEGYSNVLYGRNITAALTAVAAALLYRSASGSSSHQRLQALMGGLLVGLATQTVFTTAAPAVLLAAGMVLVGGRRQVRLAIPLYIAGVVIGFGSAIAWYVMRGVGGDFITYFWDYNLAYGGSDVGLLDRTGRAATELGLHHITRPFLLVAPITLVALLARLHKKPAPHDRTVKAAGFVGCWWFGELVSVAAPDRWFVHYWILLIAPTACLGGLAYAHLAARSQRELGRRGRQAVVGLAALAGLYAVPGIGIGAAGAAGFGGLESNHNDRLNRQTPAMAELRSVVDDLTGPDEPVFIWSSAAGPYVAVDRPAASRFDRRTWLTGEIYGSDNTIEIPGAWQALLSDLEDTQPPLIIEITDMTIDPGSPLGTYMAVRYQLTAETNIARVYRRSG